MSRQIEGGPAAPVYLTGGETLVEDDALVHIEYIHRKVHEGAVASVEYAASVGNGANLDILITVGSKELHGDISIVATGQARAYLYEAPNASGGTLLPEVNYNRLRAIGTLESIFAHTPTVTSAGVTPLVPGRVIAGGSSPQTRIGGDARLGVEWILKPATKYLLRVNNSSGSDALIDVHFEVYEEDE